MIACGQPALNATDTMCVLPELWKRPELAGYRERPDLVELYEGPELAEHFKRPELKRPELVEHCKQPELAEHFKRQELAELCIRRAEVAKCLANIEHKIYAFDWKSLEDTQQYGNIIRRLCDWLLRNTSSERDKLNRKIKEAEHFLSKSSVMSTAAVNFINEDNRKLVEERCHARHVKELRRARHLEELCHAQERCAHLATARCHTICRFGRLRPGRLLFVCTLFIVNILLLLCRIPDPSSDRKPCNRYMADDKPKVKGSSAFLVILILSSPYGRVQRDALRHTWLTYTSNDTVTYFAIGSRNLSRHDELVEEALQHGDILLLKDVADSYRTLTDKLAASFVWLADNVDFAYLFKTDVDSFARVDILTQELQKWRLLHDNRPVYWGFFDGRARVKKVGRWAEHRWLLCDRYLPHARGGGYILSADLVTYIARNSNILQRFNSEDVSVGAWLAPLDIERRHDPRFDTEHVSRGCSESYVVTHKHGMTELQNMFNSVHKSGKLCSSKGEFKTRLSYNYDWSALPSLCCIRNDSSIP